MTLQRADNEKDATKSSRLHDVALLFSETTHTHFANIVNIVEDLLFAQVRDNKIARGRLKNKDD